MKTAIYIENGLTQLVLTPESPWEQNIVKSMTEGTQPVEIKRGSFYECRGGWVRMGECEDDASLILVTKIQPACVGVPT